MDPTWGAGHVQNNKYVRKLDDSYFKADPEKLIQTHHPYDPLWQFLYYPISEQEFYNGNTLFNKYYWMGIPLN
jgi:transglutaminase/protease-like cytokinesis protein 3